MPLYATRRYGPGKCRNGHDKDYAGDCVVCAAARRERKRKKPAPDTVVELSEADVLADVEAMRLRVAERRRLDAVRRVALGLPA